MSNPDHDPGPRWSGSLPHLPPPRGERERGQEGEWLGLWFRGNLHTLFVVHRWTPVTRAQAPCIATAPVYEVRGAAQQSIKAWFGPRRCPDNIPAPPTRDHAAKNADGIILGFYIVQVSAYDGLR